MFLKRWENIKKGKDVHKTIGKHKKIEKRKVHKKIEKNKEREKIYL